MAIVPDSEREMIQSAASEGRGMSALTKTLLTGVMVFLPNQSQSGFRGKGNALRTRGYRIRQRTAERNGVKGIYVWAELPVDDAAETAGKPPR